MDLRLHPAGKGLEFPTELELIAFGPAGEAFAARIEHVLLAAGAQRTAAEVKVRQSQGGRYQAVHVPVHVQTRTELESLYEVLRAEPDVKYCL